MDFSVLTLYLISLSPLQGAGQDVGRSCILVSIGGKNIMLDCGMHMGYNDDVSKSACHFPESERDDRVTSTLSCVVSF